MSSCDTNGASRLQCPSAQPDMPGATVLGVADGTESPPTIAYLDESVPATKDLLSLTNGIEPTRLLRFAAGCEEHRCVHFDGAQCRLAQRIVQILPVVVEQLPACSIRPQCRWYAEQGSAACQRCPQVLTLNDSDDPEWLRVAVSESLPEREHPPAASDRSGHLSQDLGTSIGDPRALKNHNITGEALRSSI